MKKLQFLTALCLFAFGSLMAQQRVSGVVSDAQTGDPIFGANVIVKGTTNGTTSDFDGRFSINASMGDVLVISYIGYTRQEQTFTGQDELNIRLVEDLTQLSEVVVIGYGTASKDDTTGAVDLVSSDDFTDGLVVSPQQLIQGKIAGVSIQSNDGAPGTGSNILIRGQGSLNNSSSPLIVVDGVPLGGGVGGSRNDLNLINPNDIASFSVLKDASATAIYGSRGANGVILITTKRGETGEFSFNLRANTSVSEANTFVDVLSRDEFIATVQSLNNPDLSALLGDANTNWQREIYQTAIGQDVSANASGSFGKTRARLSLGYTNQEGILKTDTFERTSFSANFNRDLGDDLKVEVNAKGAFNKNSFANRGAIGSALDFDPTKPVYDDNSPYRTGDTGYTAWLTADGIQSGVAPTNPVALLNERFDTAESSRVVANIKADYALPFVSGLSLTVNGAIDRAHSEGVAGSTPFMPTEAKGFAGSLNTYENTNTTSTFDAYFTYDRDFNKWGVNATAGYAYQEFDFEGNSDFFNTILNADGAVDPDASTSGEFEDLSRSVLLSYFGRLNLDFDGRFLLTGTIRADASSKLNPDDRWGYFPSAAFAWNLHNEKFLRDSKIDQLKLRVGYGEVGNVNGLGDYLFLTRYDRSTQNTLMQFGDQFYVMYRPEVVNENLRWEIGRTQNIGLDFALFNSRVYGTVNAYLKETKDLIATTSLDPFTNFGNSTSANIGDMENKGVEFELGVVPIQNDRLTWSVDYNITLNDNTITNLANPQDVGGIAGGVGNTIQQHREGETPFAFHVYEQVYDANGKMIEGAYVDRNSDGLINEEDKYFYKDPFADILMGLSTSLQYKNFDFSMVTRASLGNYVYNNVASNAALSNMSVNNVLRNLNADYLETNLQQQTPRTLRSDHFVQDGSFFRIDNITLGYRFGDNYRVYASANNVLLVTDYKGLDPEINYGIDNNFYPRPQTFVLGLDVNF